MKASFWKLAWFCLLSVSCCHAASLQVLSQNQRPDPFGGIVAVDQAGPGLQRSIALTGARGGYVSFQLVVGTNCEHCRLSVNFSQPVDVYREWFHLNTPDKHYYPDALVPVKLPYSFAVPDAENSVPGQKARAFWVDVWLAPQTKPGTYHGRAMLQDGLRRQSVSFTVTVLRAQLPAKDIVNVDANSYGSGWLGSQYPEALKAAGADREGKSFQLLQQYYKVFYENRGIYHVLGYGHAGLVDPGFAPELTGTGAQMHIANWDKFDRLFGPVLDGSAFTNTRRGAQPIPFMYLPINPDWPASFMNWGEPGYQAEFTNVVSEMEKHFREKGWTSTEFEVFFNQKKRYKGFNWDGDEIRFPRDNKNFFVYHDMLEKALPKGTPVHFIMRADSSWTMSDQMRELRKVIHLWCASGGMFIWSIDQLPALRQQGDIVWNYGGTPAVQDVSSAIAEDPLRSWIYGVDGFVRWLAVDPGPHPFTALSDGGTETLVYSGERFGMEEPIPSIRLKLQRNVVQDLDLLEMEAKHGSRNAVKEQVVQLYDGTKLAQWLHTSAPPPGKPVDWNNTDISDALKPYGAQFPKTQPEAWQRVHDFAVKQANTLSAGGAQ